MSALKTNNVAIYRKFSEVHVLDIKVVLHLNPVLFYKPALWYR